MSSKHNICVLISGNGSNLQALINATTSSTTSTPALPNVNISHVISNRKNAYGVTRAAEADIPSTYHNLLPYKQKRAPTEEGVQEARREYDTALAQIIVSHSPKPELVVCAGWMHILSSAFLRALDEADIEVINLHPALPGQFNGTNAIQRAYEAFQRGEITGTGVMVHRVIEAVDEGEPLVIETVECRVGEELSGLEERIHEVEWRVIVQAVRKAIDESQKNTSES